jgi:hypothetical protein
MFLIIAVGTPHQQSFDYIEYQTAEEAQQALDRLRTSEKNIGSVGGAHAPGVRLIGKLSGYVHVCWPGPTGMGFQAAPRCWRSE